jgi:hypothetical protein
MRRTHLRHHQNILKRLLIHVAAFNLSLIFRRTIGFGTARGLQERSRKSDSTAEKRFGKALGAIFYTMVASAHRCIATHISSTLSANPWRHIRSRGAQQTFATGC